MVNYSARAGADPVTVRVRGQFQRAQWKAPGMEARALQVTAAAGGSKSGYLMQSTLR